LRHYALRRHSAAAAITLLISPPPLPPRRHAADYAITRLCAIFHFASAERLIAMPMPGNKALMI